MIRIDEVCMGQLYISDVLLEAKDHRKSMINFGIPENVAEYLHNFNNKYSLWFANQFKDLVEFTTAQDKLRWVMSQRNKMQSIIDWVKTTGAVNIREYDWWGAVEGAQAWHDSLEVATEDPRVSIGISEFTSDSEYEDYDGTILKRYTDPDNPSDFEYYWIDLESSFDREEGCCMGHCGNSTTANTLYSLRHKTGEQKEGCNSHVTLAISPKKGFWTQCKGKNNRKPNEEYWKYIADILVDSKVYEYNSEYQRENDFSTQELKSYVEENPSLFPDSEEILREIEETSLEAKAIGMWEEYDFTHFTVQKPDIYGDEVEYIDCSGGGTITLTDEQMPRVKDMAFWYKQPKYTEKIKDRLYEIVIEAIYRNTTYSVYMPPEWKQNFDGEGESAIEFSEHNGKDVMEIDIMLDDRMIDNEPDDLERLQKFLESFDNLDYMVEDEDKFKSFGDDIQEEYFEYIEELQEEFGELENTDDPEEPEGQEQIFRPFDLEGQQEFNFESVFRTMMNRRK